MTAELTDIITDGADEETDEALRNRFYEKVRHPATSGNAHHYRQWALEVSKVFPLDSGPGTVTVLIVDADKKRNLSLESVVSEYIETVRPIGATVTVSSPSTRAVDVSANVILDGTKSLDDVLALFKIQVSEYLKSLVFVDYRVSYAKIGSILLSIEGVQDYDDLKLNDATGNITVGVKEIPVAGTVSLEEVHRLASD